ncbi:MAG: hypothetical protein ACK5TO_15790 [Planctomycetaceae bacterium]|jgi:hypothetical protein
MPSLEIIDPAIDQHFILRRDPTNFQIVLPTVTVRTSPLTSQILGDALVVRATLNPPPSTIKTLTPSGNPDEYQFTNVLVVGAPVPGGVYESFKVCAWIKINGNTFTASTIPIQIKVI